MHCSAKSKPVSSYLLNEMAIQAEILFAFLVLIAGCGLMNPVTGHSNAATDTERSTNDVAFDADFHEIISMATQTSPPKRSNYVGCNKGHCWKWCDGIDDGKWCFTTKTFADSYDFVPCINESDCEIGLECGGPCRIKSTLKKLLHHSQRLQHIEKLKYSQLK